MADTKTKTDAVEEPVAPVMEETTETTEGADAPEGTEGNPPESIGLQDLQLLAQIVDLASQRGAFKGNELTQVGVVYDKLSTFLAYVAEANAKAEEQTGEAEAEAPVEAPAEGE
jgi:hypothetical protein